MTQFDIGGNTYPQSSNTSMCAHADHARISWMIKQEINLTATLTRCSIRGDRAIGVLVAFLGKLTCLSEGQ